jgi:uncharacterized protein YjbI with pentapeptide repeats
MESGERTISGHTLSAVQIAGLAAVNGPVHLVDCHFEDTAITRLDLTGWRFERCNLRRARLDDTRLEGSYWQSCRGGLAGFPGADLTDARFVSCDFNNAGFRGAQLSGTMFTGCKLTGADFAEARTLGLTFAETLLIGASLVGHTFRKQIMDKVDLSQADLRRCDFRGAVLVDCSLRDANVSGARFENADLRLADLGGIRLVDATLYRGAIISHKQAGQLLAELGLLVG